MTLNIIVAHKPEAQGIINGMSMERDRKCPEHAIYAGENIKLGICGTGYQRCRAMTKILQSGSSPSMSAGGRFDFWLNYGIGGSAGFGVGELVLADAVMYPPMSRQWQLNHFTGLFEGSVLNQATVCTVDTIEESYTSNRVYDMEAAGMLSILEETACLHRVAVLKLVSDGPELPVEDQTRKRMIELLGRSELRVQLLVNVLLNLATQDAGDSENNRIGPL